MVSRTFVVAILFVAGAMVSLVLFSRVLVPLLTDQDQETEFSSRLAATSDSPEDQPTLLPSATTEPLDPLPTVPPREQRGDPAGFYSLNNARELERSNPVAARAILSLAWVADGVDKDERETAESLIYLAASQEQLFGELVDKSWLNNAEIKDIEPVVLGLEFIASDNSLSALKLVAMPFLTLLDPPDALAIDSLAYLVHSDVNSFHGVMAQPSIRDGISDDEAAIVPFLGDVGEFNPGLLDALLDRGVTSLEERTIALPLAGEVTLAIVRTSPGAARSMDLLEEAVRTTEAFIGEPFPVTYVPLLFEEAVPGHFSGTNNGFHITILPKYDVDDDSYQAAMAKRVIAHETAHFYWNGSETWLDEGAAELMAAVVEQVGGGALAEPVNYPCSPRYSIRYLETQDLPESDEAFLCNYAVGERFFLDLYGNLVDQEFRSGFRDLYLLTSREEPFVTDAAGMKEVREVFGSPRSAGSVQSPDLVEQIAERWYEGSLTPSQTFVDTRPVVAELPEVYGWVNRAYVSMTEGGTAVDQIPSSHGGDWLWLTLQYSHDYAGPPQEISLEVVEYYEDGFPYRRDTLTILVDQRHSGGVQWLSVGPGPDQEWATGKHWIYVYHEGRKVAQVEFEVTP